jgi:hypothetical protein
MEMMRDAFGLTRRGPPRSELNRFIKCDELFLGRHQNLVTLVKELVLSSGCISVVLLQKAGPVNAFS